MKKILGLTALALLGLVSYASAQSVYGGPHWVTEQLMFRTHIAAPTQANITSPNSGYDVLGFYLDSLSFLDPIRATAATEAAEVETTTAISTRGWWAPSPAIAADSTTLVMISFTDAGLTDASVDSVTFQIQVSIDGKGWVCANPLKDVIATPLGASASAIVMGHPLVNQGGATTSVPKVFSFNFRRGAGGAQIVDKFNFMDYPLIRLVVVNKHVAGGSAKPINLKAYVGHWSILSE